MSKLVKIAVEEWKSKTIGTGHSNWHYRSGKLGDVDTALKDYHAISSPEDPDELADATIALAVALKEWMTNQSKEFSNPTRNRHGIVFRLIEQVNGQLAACEMLPGRGGILAANKVTISEKLRSKMGTPRFADLELAKRIADEEFSHIIVGDVEFSEGVKNHTLQRLFRPGSEMRGVPRGLPELASRDAVRELLSGGITRRKKIGVREVVNPLGKTVRRDVYDPNYDQDAERERVLQEYDRTGMISYFHFVMGWKSKNTEKFQQHDRALNAATRARGSGYTLEALRSIERALRDTRFGVCESLAAAFVARCKDEGFSGRLENLGIHYGGTSGHVIVVGYREGEHMDAGNKIGSVSSADWGEDYFLVDLWYYNLGMRDQYLFAQRQERAAYFESDIKDNTVEFVADMM